MVYARSRTSNKGEWRRLTITRSVLGLIVLAGLAIASLSLPLLTEASPDRALNMRRDRLERGYRLRERAPAASANRIPMDAAIAPMFASITVDRTDDAVAAGSFTAAANGCRLRGGRER